MTLRQYWQSCLPNEDVSWSRNLFFGQFDREACIAILGSCEVHVRRQCSSLSLWLLAELSE